MERKSASSHDTAVPVGCEFKRRQAEERSMEIPADQERDYFSPLRAFAQLFDFQCFQLPYQPEKFAWQICLTAYFSTEDLKIKLHQLQHLIAGISLYLILFYSQYFPSKPH